ncbi:NAD(P)H-quinone oxidoreductase subunit 3, partial [Helicobacter cinaedi]
KDREKLKLSTYECGPTPNKQQNRISTHFFILALLFILFDIEVIFMIPWAIDFKYFTYIGLGNFVFFEMLSFIAFLVVGFIYAWKKGALSWQSIK